MLDGVLNLLPVYVLALFRIAGMMLYAPLLGSDRIPKRVKGMIAVVLAFSIAPSIHLANPIPKEPWVLALAIGGEIMFGLAMGMVLSMVFVAAQWGGDIIGQQMGLNLGQTFDPEFGSATSVIGDIYFFLTLLVFICINGHRALLLGVRDSFDALPLLSVGVDHQVFESVVGVFKGATLLAMQLAAPMLVTMLVVDLVLGFVGKTVPQLNIMTAGVSIRAVVGMLVLIVGVGLTSAVLRNALLNSMQQFYRGYTGQY